MFPFTSVPFWVPHFDPQPSRQRKRSPIWAGYYTAKKKISATHGAQGLRSGADGEVLIELCWRLPLTCS